MDKSNRPPAGWYDDPTADPGSQRYWDGRRWKMRWRNKAVGVFGDGVRVEFERASYLGGCQALGSAAIGKLVVTTECVGIVGRPEADEVFAPGGVYAVLHLSSVASVEVTGEQAAKSKVGATLAFGVLGGVAAKSAQDRTTLVFRTSDGEEAYYQVLRVDVAAMRAKLLPVLRSAGVPFYGDESRQRDEFTPSFSVADELRKLAALRDEGILSAEEFDAQKARLLA